MKRTVYLEDIPLDEAWRRLTSALEAAGLWGSLEGEDVPLDQAPGRVTAAPVWARLSAPHYHASAMDGYAVRAADTAEATDTLPVRLRLGAQAHYLDTGDPLPAWADAVIPVENVQRVEVEGQRVKVGQTPPISNLHLPTSSIEIRASVTPWQHIRAMGEDMVATELVLPANETLRPVHLGAIAGCGHSTVNVRRRPKVAVIPTGTELVPAGAPVQPGDIIEYNSLVLAAQVEAWGGQATRCPIIPDDLARIRAAVAEAALSHDLILLNAGSSAGSQDFSARVVEELGTLLVHGVAVRPGHPVIVGMIDKLQPANAKSQSAIRNSQSAIRNSQSAIRNSQSAIRNSQSAIPLIGVPGYPVSAALTGEIFVEPLLAKWLGRPPAQPATIEATVTRKVLSPLGDDEYLRVTVGQVGDRVVATPLARGAGVITSLVRADGIVRIPRYSEGLQAGDRVTVHLYRHPDEISRTLVAIGSHDLTLDLMAQFLAEQGSRLSSANVGSLGGLIALRRGECHLAGTHLLDPATGEYNVSYVRQYLPETRIVLVTLVGREQGLLVRKGNPKRLHGLGDLARDEVQFVNRQRGAGTRVLLDYELAKLGISPDVVRGYEREEYTHLAVAAAVASGAADCGLGIRAAATALNLDFVPLLDERYDLAIPGDYYESPLLRPLLGLLHDSAFRSAVAALAGYDVLPMGTIAAEINPPNQPGPGTVAPTRLTGGQ